MLHLSPGTQNKELGTITTYLRPESLAETLALIGAEPDAALIAGGTDLLVKIRKRARVAPETIISLRRVGELATIDHDGATRIGASATLSAITADNVIRERFPALIDSIAVVGSPQIRNVATLAGNLCNASPAADTAPALLVYGARVELRTFHGEREMPLDEFILGPGKTALEPGEIMTAVLLDPPVAGLRAAFRRKGRVRMDLAIASVAVALELNEGLCTGVKLAAGAVAPVPLRLKSAEEQLEGKPPEAEVIEAACRAAMEEVAPIDDLRSSAWYRRELTGVLLKEAIEQSLKQGGS